MCSCLFLVAINTSCIAYARLGPGSMVHVRLCRSTGPASRVRGPESGTQGPQATALDLSVAEPTFYLYLYQLDVGPLTDMSRRTHRGPRL
ncbi:uncharacterized protein B0H18DRAFT_996244 [Fomitopsis serialis]|uniref:uncharacterized protein n=1 Tax=Fomitopsis serialis TaxID=139415 RepID=UPI0020082E27|nr:uncharacterized protein B0H18DRAFT_996244 [Neoantrodia serialis]KAH9929780.1 hypothetical protein B0H18DRAFT_996244 [Neoantrodia serialis]